MAAGGVRLAAVGERGFPRMGPDSGVRGRGRPEPDDRQRLGMDRDGVRAVSRISTVSFLSQLFRIGRAPSELQSRGHLVCRLLLEKKKNAYLVISANEKITMWICPYILDSINN